MQPLYFSWEQIMPQTWMAFVVAVICMIWLLVFYRRRVAKCRQVGELDVEDTAFPPLSVIVYSADYLKSLTHLLPAILTQDYPADFEVIVVNDGGNEALSDIVNHLALTHKNIYETFVPNDAHNLSRKKLGILLGIKAAKNQVVVITCAECQIDSSQWLRQMGAPFANGKDVVLGTASINGLTSNARRFDQLLSMVVWLSAAIKGHPYRGTGYNIAYSKKLFFDSKGFSRTMNLQNGDDDLFINQIVTPDNCVAVTAPESQVKVNYRLPDSMLRHNRLAHVFTARMLPKISSRFFGFSTMMLWLWLAAIVVGLVFSLPNIMPACVFIALVPSTIIPLAVTWRRTGQALGIKINAWLLPFQLFTRCFRNFKYRLICKAASRKNYTWMQH